MGLSLVFFFTFALIDAIFGGAVAGVLQIGGWSALDQGVNDNYQLLYGFLVLFGLLYLWRVSLSFIFPLSVIILFLGYVEDVFFYILQSIISPIIRLITQGVSFQGPSTGLFPSEISGWVGWVSRFITGESVAVPISLVFVLNGVAVILFFLLTRRRV